jgi:hypothetical protein
MRSRWLLHPTIPEVQVLVHRSFLGWVFKSRKYATRKEVEIYRLYRLANHLDHV